MTAQQSTPMVLPVSTPKAVSLPAEGHDHCPEEPLDVADIWRAAEGFYRQAFVPSKIVRHEDIEDELLFCLLGGYGIAEEHGRSAWQTVRRLEPFSEVWRDDDLFTSIMATLELPQFEPRRADGSLRRYRFPKRKAAIIMESRRWVRSHKPLEECLLYWDDPKDRRKILLGCPGLGLKSASWLLRNLGMGDGLAILDVHLVRALQDAKRISDEIRLPRDYYAVEEAFLNWCHELEAPSDAFDLFIWEWQRGTLRSG